MTDHVLVDPDALGEQVRTKYREVAAESNLHFHTGRPLAVSTHMEYCAPEAPSGDLKAAEMIRSVLKSCVG